MKYKFVFLWKGILNRLSDSVRIFIWINLEGNCDLRVINFDKFGKDNIIIRIFYLL